MSTWKVGELARRTGLTVRTLHHYDRIGLLSPSRRSAAGYRLYDVADVGRLHRIVALRQQGLSLEEVRQSLAGPAWTLERVLRVQLEWLEARRQELGAEHIRAVEAEWSRLIAAAKDCLARGVEPTAEEVRPLAQRCRELVREFTGGEAAIARSVSRVYENEPTVRERTGLDPAVMEYIGRAIAAVGGW